MALSATTIFEVRSDGSDTLNGGAFDPGQTAGMFTDGAAASATGASPVFSSASYNFVAGDVGAWIYIASGTNWTAGWYQIASVASNNATLSAAIGAAVLATQHGMTTVDGCATTASPTGATWTIDYSQQAAAKFAYTDLASAGTGLTVSSVAKPFGKQHVGNAIVITGGTNFNTGRYVIASVAAVTFIATVVGPTNITTGAGVNGTGGLGGGVANPGTITGLCVAGNQVAIKAATYTISSTTANITNGRLAPSSTYAFGYSTNRHHNNTDTKPILQATVGSMTIYTNSSSSRVIVNVTVDGNGQSSVALVSDGQAFRCHLTGQTAVPANGPMLISCTITSCSTAFSSTAAMFFCEAYANTATPFINGGNLAYYVGCIARSNTGAATDGFAGAGYAVGCVAYANGRHGFANTRTAINCVAEGNTGAGFVFPGSTAWNMGTISCAAYNNTGGATSGTPLPGNLINFLTLTDGSPFVDAANSNFALNNTALRGALLRAVGYPATFPSGLTANYADIGVAQHADPVAAKPNIFDSGIIRSVPHDSY